MTETGITNPDDAAKFANHIVYGEQRRRDTDYAAIELRILNKLKKLPSYDLDWVECMINHLIARTQRPPGPARMGEQPDPAVASHKHRTAPGGQAGPFDGTSGIRPIGDERTRGINDG